MIHPVERFASDSILRRLVSTTLLLLIAMSVLVSSDCVFAQATSKPANKEKPAEKQKGKKRDVSEVPGPKDFHSPNFLLHTDLSKDEAEELLKRLESMLSLISKYWGRPNKQVIECYVVQDLSLWPPGVLSREGRAKIEERAGVTMTQSRGISDGRTTIITGAKATVYAIADRGTPQHEAVHAYCGQNFGRTGPVWYSEGMAEMGQYWKVGESRVTCHPQAVKFIRTSEPKSLNSIVNAPEITGDSWENYCWRWALCHLLANNPNYYDRFRPLGLGILMEKPDATFENVYGSMAKEISFEYLFFLQHFDLGYEVTLTAWDWKTKFRRATGSAAVTCTVEANRGWQASRLLVKAGDELELTVDGSWTLAADGQELNAFGVEASDVKPKKETTTSKSSKSAKSSAKEPLEGVMPYESNFKLGQLVGILFNDYELSEPFAIPADGTFTAPGDGQLFLRCEEAWNKLSDNTGKVNLKFKPK